MSLAKKKSQGGFTFIEILVAIAIFTLAVVAAVNIATGSVQATQDSKDITLATFLLQQKIVELETQIESEGVEKGCDEEKSGKFEGEYERFTWETSCNQVDFYLSETAAQLAGAAKNEDEDESNVTSENQVVKLVLDTASKYITESVRELHAEVNWETPNGPRSVDVTTHWARYDQKVRLPGLGGFGSSTGGSN